VPTAPPVPTQAPNVPSATPQAPSGQPPSTGSTPNTGRRGSGSGSDSGSGSGGSAQPPATGGGAGGGSTGSGGSDSGSDGARAGGEDAGAQSARVVRRDRRLRREVRRLEPCFGVLPRVNSRVLTLRAGLDGDDPLSRAQVARRLDRGARSVGRIERRSVARLRVALRDGRCTAATSGGSESSDPGATGSAGTGTDGSSAAGSGSSTAPDGQGLPDGAPASEIDSQVGVKGESEDNLGPFGMFSSPATPLNVWLPILLGLLLLTGFALWRFRRRRQPQ